MLEQLPKIDRDQGGIYTQLSRIFEAFIAKNLSIGEKFFPEKKLAEYYGVSSLTIARAIETLVHRGILERRRGAGTYVSNPSLAGTRSIGIVVANMTTSFFSDITAGINHAAREDGLTTLLCDANNDPELEAQYLRQHIASPETVGIILEAGRMSLQDSFLNRILELTQKPIVFINEPLPELACDFVHSDDFEGARELGRFLANHEKTDWVYLAVTDTRISNERIAGLQKATEDCEGTTLAVFENFPQTVEEIEDLLKKNRLKLNRGHTALIGFNDAVAATAMKAVQAHGYSIAKDIAVAGFGDLELGRYCQPTLTTVSQSSENVGRKAYQLLRERLSNPKRTIREIVIPCQILPRQSTGD